MTFSSHSLIDWKVKAGGIDLGSSFSSTELALQEISAVAPQLVESFAQAPPASASDGGVSLVPYASSNPLGAMSDHPASDPLLGYELGGTGPHIVHRSSGCSSADYAAPDHRGPDSDGGGGLARCDAFTSAPSTEPA